jgi:hypothetical protein
MFRRLLKPSSGMSIQISYKGRYSHCYYVKTQKMKYRSIRHIIFKNMHLRLLLDLGHPKFVLKFFCNFVYFNDIILYDIFVNFSWVDSRWQLYSTHLHTNSTQNNTKQTIHRTTQLIWEECGPCPVFASYTLAFALQLRKKHGKTSVRVAEECQLARWRYIIIQ